MATKNSRKVKDTRPTLVACGKHLINVSDVSKITQVRKNLFVVKFFSDPNPDFPCWVEGKHIGSLLKHFNIIAADESTSDDDRPEQATDWDQLQHPD